MKRVIKYIKNPWKIFGFFATRGLLDVVSDEVYLKGLYKSYLSQNLDLKNPKTFNEKLQWLKLYDRKSEYVQMVDKHLAKKYVADKIGKEYIIPTIGVWDSVEDIDFETLPEQFVLKCNHNSGMGMCICTDKTKLDTRSVINQLKKGMKQDYYKLHREWCYKDVQRKIIAEEYISSVKDGLIDYKFMCFNGRVKYCFTCTNRFSKNGLKVTFFDREWNKMPFERHYPSEKEKIEKPKSYEKMIELAEKLAEGIPFVRVDFYEVNEQPLFGELTFYPGAGFEEFSPPEWDRKLGDLLQLPELND